MVHQTKAFEEQTAMLRIATIDEMVRPAVFLLSDAASYVSGDDPLVDRSCWQGSFCAVNMLPDF